MWFFGSLRNPRWICINTELGSCFFCVCVQISSGFLQAMLTVDPPIQWCREEALFPFPKATLTVNSTYAIVGCYYKRVG